MPSKITWVDFSRYARLSQEISSCYSCHHLPSNFVSSCCWSDAGGPPASAIATWRSVWCKMLGSEGEIHGKSLGFLVHFWTNPLEQTEKVQVFVKKTCFPTVWSLSFTSQKKTWDTYKTRLDSTWWFIHILISIASPSVITRVIMIITRATVRQFDTNKNNDNNNNNIFPQKQLPIVSPPVVGWLTSSINTIHQFLSRYIRYFISNKNPTVNGVINPLSNLNPIKVLPVPSFSPNVHPSNFIQFSISSPSSCPTSWDGSHAIHN